MSGVESTPDAGGESETEPAGEETFTGQGLNRVEDHRILTGDAYYVHDLGPENAVHMALARSVHPHARIVDIDTSAAEDHPDCLDVMTGQDVAADFKPQPCGLTEFGEWSLAVDKVRFVGEPVVAICATDRYAAEDIVDLVSIEYDKLDPVVDPMDARKDDTIIHEDAGTNIPDAEELTFGDVDDAFEDADHVIEGSYSWGRLSGVPLETAGVVATYDTDRDAFDVDCNIQLHTLVDDTIYETLDYPPERVTVSVPPDVGGSFGTKIGIHRYCNLAAMASKRLDGTPVKFVEDRVENLQGGDMHSTQREYDVKIAVDDDGTIQGFDFWFVDDFGAYPRYPINQVLKPLSCVTGAYDVPSARYEYELALTNKTSQTAYRGFGVPAHLYALEMMVDDAARELGFDPLEFRRQNLIRADQMPYKLPSKNIYDSGDFPAALDQLQEHVEKQEAVDGGLLDPEIVESKRAEEGKYRGVSYSLLIEPGVSGSDWTDRQRSDRAGLKDRNRADVQELPEYLRAELLEDGTVQAFLATDSSGQGHQTLVTQLLADELDILPSDIEVEYLDSVSAPTEYGSAASRMAVMLSGAAQGLGEELTHNCRELAAEEGWSCHVDDVVYRDGGVTHIESGERLSLSELFHLDRGRSDRLTRASFSYDHPATGEPDFDEALTQKYPVYPTAAFAANAPIVEVDTKTGEVDILKFYSLRDCGTQLNPTIVEGQAHGGLAQGIGAALMEEFGYDDEGQPQAITFFDYLLPSIKNMPEMELMHTETPSPFTVSGAKGTGEGGMIDGPAALALSINEALAEQGVRADKIPFTPHRVRQRLRNTEE